MVLLKKKLVYLLFYTSVDIEIKTNIYSALDYESKRVELPDDLRGFIIQE